MGHVPLTSGSSPPTARRGGPVELMSEGTVLVRWHASYDYGPAQAARRQALVIRWDGCLSFPSAKEARDRPQRVDIRNALASLDVGAPWIG